jgi:hypothetical protein
VIIQPIVEGHGEIDAVPVLLRRICYELGCCTSAKIAHPIRVPRSKMVQEAEIRRFARIASSLPGCNLILLVMDADGDCAKAISDLIRPWIITESLCAHFEIIVIPREYECWIIAALESLQGVRGIGDEAAAPRNPEQVRDAKGYITGQMAGRGRYQPTADQAALSQLVDLQAIRDRCPSFCRLISKIENLSQSISGR